MALRHYCPAAHAPGSGAAVLHDSGPGRSKRKKCRYCGSRMAQENGLYGVFAHSQGNPHAYSISKAVRCEETADSADSTAARLNRREPVPGGWVVRWIPGAYRTDTGPVAGEVIITTL